MPSTPNSALPYPAGTAAPYAAADMQALAEALDPRVVLRAADAADRDARYLSPVPGMLVAADDGTMWVATQTGAWLTVVQPDPGWVNCTLSPGVVSTALPVAAKKIGNHVWLRGHVTNNNSGVIPNGNFAYVPAGYEPRSTTYAAVGASVDGSRTYSTTRIGISASGEIYLSTDQDPGGDPPWLSIDGTSYWID